MRGHRAGCFFQQRAHFPAPGLPGDPGRGGSAEAPAQGQLTVHMLTSTAGARAPWSPSPQVSLLAHAEPRLACCCVSTRDGGQVGFCMGDAAGQRLCSWGMDYWGQGTPVTVSSGECPLQLLCEHRARSLGPAVAPSLGSSPGPCRTAGSPLAPGPHGDETRSWQSSWGASTPRARQTGHRRWPGRRSVGPGFLWGGAGHLHQCGHDYLDVWGQGTPVTISSGNCTPVGLARALGGMSGGRGARGLLCTLRCQGVDAAGARRVCVRAEAGLCLCAMLLVTGARGPWSPCPQVRLAPLSHPWGRSFPKLPGLCGAVWGAQRAASEAVRSSPCEASLWGAGSARAGSVSGARSPED